MPKININGVIREMTPEEIAETELVVMEMSKPVLSNEERLAKLEEENTYIKEAISKIFKG